MSKRLEDALKTLRDILQEEAPAHCVYVNVFINCEGYQLEYRTRSPGGLERDGLSMRNLRGEFIKKSSLEPTP